jgi:hypothetical protein
MGAQSAASPDGECPPSARTIGGIAVHTAPNCSGKRDMRQIGDSVGALRSDRLRAVTGAVMSALLPMRIARDSWWLALVAIGVLQQAHLGLHEHRELSPLVHLLRDAALAVPAAAVAVVVASAFVARRLVSRATFRRPGVADRLLWVVIAAGIFAVLSVPGNQLHSTLFGAEDEEELSWLADVALDAGIALIGALLALVPLVAVAGLPIQDPDTAVSRSIELPRPVLETSARSTQ